MTYSEMKELLKKSLKESRYVHSVGVADTAVFLAERFDVSVEKARTAGLLHDCAREFSNEEMEHEADKRGISYGPVEKNMPLLLHGYIGSFLISEKYQVNDSEISQAIYRHTVGGEHMTKLDKIIYFADMIEPARDYPGVEELRRLSRETSLDEMLLAGMSQSILFVTKKGHLIHPDTVLARNELILEGTRTVL